MNRLKILALLSAILGAQFLACPAHAQTPAEVVAAERAFAADAQQRGWIAAFKTYSAPDAVLLRDTPISAKENLAKLPDTPADTSLKWWPIWAGISQSGDLGFTTGPFTSGDKNFGHYFTVWQRQPDGTWRWIYDGGPSNESASPFGPDTEPELLPVATATSASSEAALAEVGVLEVELARRAVTDSRVAYLSYLAEDARIMGSPAQPARGRAEIIKELDRRAASLKLTSLGGTASHAGDLAFTYGSARWSREGQGRRGNYVRIWQKRVERWQLVFDELLAAPVKPQP
ncbi:MAG: nuclear transport factor 2 family protein [Rhodospirillaceae bacterium]|nr:nuclear transport factor 2 family protein [Rhodospirillaceae bacterium]